MKQNFSALSGIRLFMFLPVFFLHAHGGSDWSGWCMCALSMFFLLSGLLTAYGRYDSVGELHARDLPRYTWNFLYKKIAHFYPLHVGCFLYCVGMFLCFPQFGCYRPGSVGDALLKAVLNLTLVQAWFPAEHIKFCYNGVSWFLSALMFCYAAAPLTLWLLKKTERRRGIGGIVAVAAAAIAVGMLPYLFERDGSISHDWCTIFKHEWHGWVPLRWLQFVVGMCFGILLKQLHTLAVLQKKSMAVSVALHVGIGITLLCLLCHQYIPAPLLLLPECLLLCFLTFPGIFWLRFLSWHGIVTLGQWVMPVYLTHNLVLKTVRLIPGINLANYSTDFCVLILCFALGGALMAGKTLKFRRTGA